MLALPDSGDSPHSREPRQREQPGVGVRGIGGQRALGESDGAIEDCGRVIHRAIEVQQQPDKAASTLASTWIVASSGRCA